MSALHANVWDRWVGSQTPAEFLAECSQDRPLDEHVEEYVADMTREWDTAREDDDDPIEPPAEVVAELLRILEACR